MKRRTAVFLIGLLPFAGCSEIAPVEPRLEPAFTVAGAAGPVVMTRNIYLGTDLDPVIGAPSPEAVPLLAAEAWEAVQASNFPLRAQALANEIVQDRPHLVGLQEVALYRTRTLLEPAGATTVAYDFLQLLMDALAERGADYQVVSQVSSTDVELPVFNGLAFPAGPVTFVRYTDRDVILARGDVATSNPAGDVFAARITLNVGGPAGPPVTIKRGWTSVDAVVGGRPFRFVNTHLEVQSFAPVQTAQAQELIVRTGLSPLPVVMLGDFNSAADGSQTPAYGMFLNAGFRDVWNRKGDPGYTCCQAKDLLNKHSQLDQRLDIIFIRGFDTSRFQAGGQPRIVGATVGERMRWGIWPSDHAGVVALLRLPPHTN